MKYVPGDEIPWCFTLMLSGGLISDFEPSVCFLSIICHREGTRWDSPLLMDHLDNVHLITLTHCLTLSLLYTSLSDFQIHPQSLHCLAGYLSLAHQFLTFNLIHQFLSKFILPNPVLTNRMWVISWKSIEKIFQGEGYGSTVSNAILIYLSWNDRKFS